MKAPPRPINPDMAICLTELQRSVNILKDSKTQLEHETNLKCLDIWLNKLKSTPFH